MKPKDSSRRVLCCGATTRHHNPEDHDLILHCRENFIVILMFLVLILK